MARGNIFLVALREPFAAKKAGELRVPTGLFRLSVERLLHLQVVDVFFVQIFQFLAEFIFPVFVHHPLQFI